MKEKEARRAAREAKRPREESDEDEEEEKQGEHEENNEPLSSDEPPAAERFVQLCMVTWIHRRFTRLENEAYRPMKSARRRRRRSESNAR